MTNEDIIRMANDTKLCAVKWVDDDDDADVQSLYYFAAELEAAVREACVEEVEKIFQQEASMDTMREYVKRIIPYEKAIEAIRARGQG